ARDRLARVQALAKQTNGQGNVNIEAALAVAQAAIDAREFAVARAALKSLAEQPTRRVATLMAELEETESGDVGRAREWMARALKAAADRAWTADGVVSEHWMPVSPVTGRLDAFQWKVPLAELPDEGLLLEERRPVAPVVVQGSHQAPAASSPAPTSSDADIVVPPAPPASAQPAAPRRTSSTPARQKPTGPRVVEPGIPLVHAPDDPGPEPDEPPSDGWRRLRHFFGG